MIFDTHVHYEDKAFDKDRRQLLDSLAAHGIKRAVNVSSSLETVKQTLALIGEYPFLYGAVGIHPSETMELNEESFNGLKAAAKQDKVVAIGEIGLDYHWEEPDRKTQLYWFERQLLWAKEENLPVIIHSRDAAKDTLDQIRAVKDWDLSMVIHCFGYGKEMAREYLNMGHYLGIGGVVTFKNAKKLKEVVQYMPLDRLLLETDCPYLSPEPFRGTRNSSVNLPYVAAMIANLKGVSEEEVYRITWENACRFYRMEEIKGEDTWRS